jgi:putative ABC transport system substrate-binding protein
MRRRALFALGAIASLPFTLRAQPQVALRIGILHPVSVEASQVYKVLVPGLREQGYVEGRNIVLELRSGLGKPELLPKLAADLVRVNADMIVAVGPPAVKATMEATHSIPIVAIDLETDPVASGWIASMARPGGNVTGFFLDLTAMSVKWLQLLREAVPAIRQIALLWDTTSGTSQIEATRAAAQASGISVEVVPITNWDRIGAMLSATGGEAQALVALSSPMIFQYSARLADFTRQRRLPAITPFRPFVEAGGLMSYGPNLQLYFQRTALTIDRIARGARPTDIAIEQPTQFELVINLKTAKALGLTIPQALLLRADDVIQ